MIFIILILTCVIRCNGFLFDENTTPSNGGGSSLSDKHYLAVIDLILEEKQARQQMEYYMTQLKEKILETQNKTQNLETKLGHFSPKNDTTKEENEIQLLKNVTESLLQEYRSLDKNYEQLQHNYLQVLKEYSQLTERCNSTTRQLDLITQELEGLKSLQAINQLQDLKNLQHENSVLQQKLQMTNNRIDSLASTQQARGQDLLALYNKAQTMENDLLQLAIQQNVTYSQLTMEKQQVALTSCGSYGNVQGDVPMLFPSTVTSIGIANQAAFKSSGAFTCDLKGLYLVSLTVMSDTQDSYFHIYKNSEYLVDVYTSSISGNEYFTGTALVVVQLDMNDKVTVKPHKASLTYDFSTRHNTCLTVLKVK